MMLRPTLIALACAAALSLPLQAQIPFTADSSKTSAVGFHAWNNGIFPLQPSLTGSSFAYPRDSDLRYIFGAGLWFGAVKRVGGQPRQLTFLGYNPSAGTGWGTPGPVGSVVEDGNTWMSWSTRVDQASGVSQVPGRPSWPLWREPVDRISLLNPGRWARDTSLRHRAGLWTPSFVPGVAEQATTIFHDGDLTRYDFGEAKALQYGYPLGLQVQQNIYAWSTGPLAASVIVQYEIVNVGADTLRDCFVGQVTDLDIGDGRNDHFAYFHGDASLRTALAWTDNSASDPSTYRTLAITILEAPTVDANGRPDNRFRAPFSGQLPIQAARSMPIENDPTKPDQWYSILSTPELAQDGGARDQRGVMSTGPFSLMPGDTTHFAILYSIVDVDWPISEEDVDVVRNHVLGVREVYFTTPASSAPTAAPTAGSAAIAAMPNPASGAVTIRGTLPGPRAELSVVDALGGVIIPAHDIDLTDGRFAMPIDFTGLPPGAYVVTVRSGEIVRSVMVAHTGE